jgi:transketolase
LIGTHAGLNVGPDGGSHQALEDIALMRVLPRMTVLSPCDALEAAKCASLMGKTDGPVYIRLPREKSLILTHEKSPFEIGKASIFYESSPKISDLGIIATGPLLYRTLLAAKKLESLGKKVTVMNLSTIKPLDEGAIINLAKKTKAIVTIEEHQRFGGMGSAVAECLVTHHPVPIEFVAVNDRFGQSGQAEELLDLYGFRVEDIVEAGKRVVLRKER